MKADATVREPGPGPALQGDDDLSARTAQYGGGEGGDGGPRPGFATMPPWGRRRSQDPGQAGTDAGGEGERIQGYVSGL